MNINIHVTENRGSWTSIQSEVSTSRIRRNFVGSEVCGRCSNPQGSGGSENWLTDV